MEDFSDEVVLITGGTKGIGFATAKQFIKRDATVVINYYSDDDSANEAVNQLKEYSGSVDSMKFDVAESAAVKSAIEEVFEEHGKISTLINNAGMMDNDFSIRMSDEQWDRIIKTNLYGQFYCAREVGKKMIFEKIKGNIVNVSSIASDHAYIGQSNYGASKAAINNLTKILAKEFGTRNIRVNAVVPGLTETEMYRELPEEVFKDTLGSVPLDRPAKPDEIANMIRFITSDQSSYVNGSIIRVDGGANI